MKRCKITVLKTTLDKEPAAAYGAEGLGACPMMVIVSVVKRWDDSSKHF